MRMQYILCSSVISIMKRNNPVHLLFHVSLAQFLTFVFFQDFTSRVLVIIKMMRPC
jgi:hypothetical protein